MPWILAVTKVEMYEQAVVCRQDILQFASRTHPRAVVETSARSAINIDAVFNEAVRAALAPTPPARRISDLQSRISRVSAINPSNWSKLVKWNNELKRLQVLQSAADSTAAANVRRTTNSRIICVVYY